MYSNLTLCLLQRFVHIQDAIREIVREELDVVRDEMEEAMRNLQVDICRKFIKQSQEYNELVLQLQEENNDLRQENEFLRTHG